MAKKPVTYQSAGVDAPREELALQRIIKHFQKTWPQSDGLGSVKLDIGYFANVIDIGGVGLAITADGVGTKLLIAQLMQDYRTIGIDCVAMNVNDLLCVGAKPISMVDYIAVQEAKPDLLEDIAIGLCEGAKRANISIPGGEIAQLRDVIKGHKEGYGFDLAGTAVGIVPLDRIIVGQNIKEGDLVIGIESSGVHSNGLTLARRAFFEQNTFTVDTVFSSLETSLGKELLKPTHIYVKEALDILEGIPVKAFVHITSDGFLNLTRVVAEVGYIIDELPEPPQIFSLIQSHGNITDEQMFTVYNMGIGFCVVVSPDDAPRVFDILRSHRRKAYRIGFAISDKERRCFIKSKSLIGKGKEFVRGTL